MRTVSFVLDTQTGSDGMAPVTVTITENDGSLVFSVTNINDGDDFIGDIRGLFFDVSDDALLGNLLFDGGEITQIIQDGSVSNLGGGVTSNGVPDSPYEVGVEFGTPGMSTDDYQTVSFTLSSSTRPLTLDDVSLESITVRQTSVSSADGGREDSDKLYGTVPYAVDAVDDYVDVSEDETASGSLFTNDIDKDAGDADGDGIADGLTITDIDGDASLVGSTITVANGIYVTVNADGTYTVDALDADWLADGEEFGDSFIYTVNDGNGGSDTAEFSFTVAGVNDTPDAAPDTNTTDEATSVTGNVLENDTDPDLSDTLMVSAVNGDGGSVNTEVTLASGALLTLNEDGTYSYNPNGAFDGLYTGEQATDTFSYDISDGHGGFSTTTVTITIDGIGEREEEDTDHFGTFLNKKGVEQDISNVVLYVKDEDGDVLKVKIDDWHGITDLDDVDLDGFLTDVGYSDYELFAVSIKAGNNHNKDLGPGEGQLFMLDGDEDIDYLAGGDVPDGLTADLLSAHANVTYSFGDYFA